MARLRRRISARTQPHFAERQMVNHAITICYSIQLGSSPRKNGAKKLVYLFGFSTTLTLNGEYLLNETWHKQSGKGTGKYEGSPTLSKISQTLVHKRLKTGPDFLPTFTILFRPSPSHTFYAPHSDSKWNGIGFVCSSDLKPHKMLSCNCYCVWRP